MFFPWYISPQKDIKKSGLLSKLRETERKAKEEWNRIVSDEKYRMSLKSVIIPNSVTKIHSGAFYKCSNLTSIIIPNSVKIIENEICNSSGYYEGPFRECTLLPSITIPNSVTSIGNYAFKECPLTSIIIPNSVTSIGDSAFQKCTSLSSTTLPDPLTSIDYAFYQCSSLKEITIYSNNQFDSLSLLLLI